ncbi:MAG: hypothetical protein BYD32DRAFT_466485 [Podila humilis]|nr:MAG: hypothetical protein BYD32DRAFT_466485 [Podila humilis]
MLPQKSQSRKRSAPSFPPASRSETKHVHCSHHLAKTSDLDFLALLLTVNKSFCQITLSHLYSNPFLLLEQNIPGSSTVVRFRRLAHLLLTTSVLYNEYSDLLKAMYEINDYNLNDTPSRPLKIKYLEYLRHFDLTQGLVTLNSSKGDTLDVFPRLSQHVEQYELNYGKSSGQC